MARCAFGGNCIAASESGCSDAAADEANGRRKRVRNVGIWKAMMAMRATRRVLRRVPRVLVCSLPVVVAESGSGHNGRWFVV